MFANVTRVSWWKTEHDEKTNEDASAASAQQGLFAVSDGVGTALFSMRWANMLVSHFMETPLLSNDPFEVEWWVHPIQAKYEQEIGDIHSLHRTLQKKAREGSAATLATARITAVTETSATARLLVFGDSCIFIASEEQGVRLSFPLRTPQEFDAAPICVPSLETRLDRNFHRCHLLEVPLNAENSIILATDAVSKWILSHGANTYASSWQALQQVVASAQSPDSWQLFITGCRERREMVDDDSTALIVRLSARPEGVLLGCTPTHSEAIINERRKDLQRALQDDDKESIALAYGDGQDLAGMVQPAVLEQSKQVANALLAVWQTFYKSINEPDVRDRVVRAWERNAALLMHEPCAEKLRHMLVVNDFLPEAYFHPEKRALEEQQQREQEERQKREQIEQLQYVQAEQQKRALEEQLQRGQAERRALEERLRREQEERRALEERLRREQEERQKREQIEQLQYVQAEQQRRINDLIDAIYACKSDSELLELAKSISKEEYQRISERARKRIDEARQRDQILGELRQAFSHATAREMVRAYDECQSKLNDYPPLAAYKTQYALARDWLQACARADSKKIFDVYTTIEHSGYFTSFNFTPPEMQQIRAAKEQEVGWRQFREITQLPNLTPEAILLAYKKVQSSVRRSPADEQDSLAQDLITLARWFISAYQDKDNQSLIDAYTAMQYYSRYTFTYTEQEHRRIQSVLGKVHHRALNELPVMLMDEKRVTAEQFRNFCLMYQLYYSSPPSDNILRGAFTTFKYEYFYWKHEKSHFHVLKQGISEAKKEYEDSLDGFKERIKHRYDPSYTNFLRNQQLKPEDITKFFQLFATWSKLDAYLQEQGLSIDEWLQKQGDTTRIIYPEWAVMEKPSENTDWRLSWVRKWNGWISPAAPMP